MDQATAQKILKQTKQDYDAIAPEFSASRSFLWEELKQFGNFVKQGAKVLDVGCGNGRLFRLFRGQDIFYTGIDSSPRLIELARKIWQGTTAHFEVGDVLDLGDFVERPSPDETSGLGLLNKFDVVFAIALLHHIPSEELRQQAVQNIAKTLKPGGLLIATVWNLWQPRFWLAHLHNTITRILGRSELDYNDLLIPWKGSSLTPEAHSPSVGKGRPLERYYHAFTKKEFYSLIQNTGFKIMDQYCVKKGRRTSWLRGHNLVVIAKKIV